MSVLEDVQSKTAEIGLLAKGLTDPDMPTHVTDPDARVALILLGRLAEQVRRLAEDVEVYVDEGDSWWFR